MPTGQLHIGWSQIEITPPKKTLLQGQFHARLADTAISPLTATALAVETRALDDSLEQAIFLSCDLVAEGFKSDLLAKLAGRCRGFDINKLTINATHTHNAPPVQSGMYEEPKDDPDFTTPDAYRGFLVDRLADAVESAWETYADGEVLAKLGAALGLEGFDDGGDPTECLERVARFFFAGTLPSVALDLDSSLALDLDSSLSYAAWLGRGIWKEDR